MELILIVALCALVWWLARYWKDRNGILWGMLTLALTAFLTPLYMLGSRVLFVAGALVITGIIIAVVALLPATKVCPYCKRRIHAEAVVCSHCQTKLADNELKAS